MLAVRAAIASGLPEWMRTWFSKPSSSANPGRPRHVLYLVLASRPPISDLHCPLLLHATYASPSLLRSHDRLAPRLHHHFVLSLPSAAILFPFTLLTGNAGRSTRSAAGSPASPSAPPASVCDRRPRKHPARPRVHLHGQPRFQPRRACAYLVSPRPHLGLLQASADEASILGYAFKLGELHPGRPRRPRRNRAAMPSPRPGACSPGDCTSLHLLRASALSMAACCPSRKARSISPMDSGAPCIPISIYGTEKILPWGEPARIHPGSAHIIFHPASDPADYSTRDDLLRAVRAAIVSALPDGCDGRMPRERLSESDALPTTPQRRLSFWMEAVLIKKTISKVDPCSPINMSRRARLSWAPDEGKTVGCAVWNLGSVHSVCDLREHAGPRDSARALSGPSRR